jgi:hypothetical protein
MTAALCKINTSGVNKWSGLPIQRIMPIQVGEKMISPKIEERPLSYVNTPNVTATQLPYKLKASKSKQKATKFPAAQTRVDDRTSRHTIAGINSFVDVFNAGRRTHLGVKMSYLNVARPPFLTISRCRACTEVPALLRICLWQSICTFLSDRPVCPPDDAKSGMPLVGVSSFQLLRARLVLVALKASSPEL